MASSVSQYHLDLSSSSDSVKALLEVNNSAGNSKNMANWSALRSCNGSISIYKAMFTVFSA